MTANPGASAAAIQHHYDVGNELYRLFLDESMTYSAALFTGDEDLEAAQVAKIEHHIAAAHAANAKRVLDIGCGWGATLRRLVEHHGVGHATGLTLSREQAAWIGERPNVTVRIESWTDHVPAAPYDAIISVGAFEHFARHDSTEREKIAGYRAFFERCHAWLAPGGHLSLQTIAYGNSRRADFSPFFANEVFPESDLPRLQEIAAASDLLFEIESVRNDRAHYERTCVEWRRRLRAHRDEAVAAVGEEVVRRYDKYFQMLAIGFHVGSMGLLRLGMRRIDEPVASSV
jgi:cyclopropane-fatty-acyl-phospholipid synthase